MSNRGTPLLLRLLLWLYPPSFRATYGQEMIEFVRERSHRARRGGGRRGHLRFWAKVTLDIIRTAVAERFASHRTPSSGHRIHEPMITLMQDLRHAARHLLRSPLFTACAILILTVGIGLNAAVFSLADALAFRPPPFDEPERVVHIYQDSDGGDPSSTSFPAYRDMAAMSDVFAGVAAVSGASATWESAQGPRQASVQYATSSYLPVLGLHPRQGRWFGTEHDQLGGEMAAVVSHRTWRSALGADPDVVGRTVRLNGQTVTIIGVGPESFNGDGGVLVNDFWLSISATPVGGPFRVANLERRQDHWYQVKARLAPGITPEAAQQAMNGLARRLGELFPDLNRGRDITVFRYDDVRLHPSADASVSQASTGILLLGGLVLLLACGNLANLLLVRATTRRSETAVRRAMGAGRGGIVRIYLLEALLLAVPGALLGLALAAWTMRFIPFLPLPVGGAGLDVAFDHRVAIFGALMAGGTALVFGLLPALRASGVDVAGALRDGGRGRSATRNATFIRRGLVAAQVALCAVLIAAAGLLARSFANAAAVDPGVDAARIAVLGTNLRQGGLEAIEAAPLLRELLDQVAALPGVEGAAATTRLPAQPAGTTTQVVDGFTPATGTGSLELDFAIVTGGYFETMGIPLLEGRSFGPGDAPDGLEVVVVNETAARQFWGGDAVGGRIRSQDDPEGWNEVVGVVADVPVADLREAPTPMIYYAVEQGAPGVFSVVARAEGDPAALTRPLREVLQNVHPTLPVTRLGTLEEHFGGALADLRVAATLLGVFSLLALLLAAFGIHAVVAFTVETRTRELGIRLALGAAPRQLVRSVVVESLTVTAAGLALGLVLALLGARSLDALLFGVDAIDPVTLGATTALLLMVAAIASLAPARHAARTHPAASLQSG